MSGLLLARHLGSDLTRAVLTGESWHPDSRHVRVQTPEELRFDDSPRRRPTREEQRGECMRLCAKCPLVGTPACSRHRPA